MQENKMKPKRIPRHAGPKWQRKGVSTGDKAMLSQAKPTCGSSSAQAKPFAGKVFYLDLPSNRIAEMLENDIKDLGGTVEKFFSKEIKYLVSNKREARYVQCIRQDSAVPNADSGPSSTHPRSNRDKNKSTSLGQTDTFVPSRGKSLVEKVVKEQEGVKMNKILSNALEWGVKILYIDDILAYVKKKKKIVSSQCPATTAVKTSVKAESAAKQGFKKCKGGRIGKPFVKVEDSSRHYRPIYLTMLNMPEFNLKSAPPCSPFCVEDKLLPGNKQLGRRGAKASASEELANGRKKNKDKKRGGYCECCLIKYENVTMHLKSERHKAFSKSDKYSMVDKLVSTLHYNFHTKTTTERPKCSVSSVLVAPGPCGHAVQRLDEREIRKEEEQHQTVDGHEGSDSAHTLTIGLVPSSTPLTPRERKSYTHSDRSKHKSLARKRPCRQNSLTSCSQKAEQAQISESRMETAPSRGECFASIPSRVPQVNEVDRTATQDVKNSSTSRFHNVNIQKEGSLRCLNVITNQQEDKKPDSSEWEVVQDGNAPVDKMTVNNLSERREESLSSHSFSPVRKIQRRVRVYKRKRRKADTCVKSVKSSDIPDNSMIKLGAFSAN
ncbi:protein DBF4 homolog A isoform X2 [Pseudoliparis swirei]|uniref:protein DBF4 homolog A isoform X2 n=1 Tax=Pseudoliparis swirei TaxID=2059687 RepID=UPI0024BEF543|nr:protein DBF4 homolog A isoform X2 [Pseudoliparis swirei]